MIKLKWGDLPLGTLVFCDGVPCQIVNTKRKSVFVLDLYQNQVVVKRSSTQANVQYKLR